jgi:tRNA wybutosine-synthesizing protein 1
MMPESRTAKRQQYRMVGKHSAVKVCHWTRKSLKDEGVCYKEQFYGIPCHRCCQMTPCLLCSNKCVFCWRDLDAFNSVKMAGTDDPKEIVDRCIEMQRHLLNGFPGNEKANKRKLKEAQDPKTFAISLSGEPTIYPKLSGLLAELKKRGICSFLVTNGQFPEALEKLDPLPTQLYVSLDAPNRELYKKIDRPSLPDFWERFNRTLELLPRLKTRAVLRITAIKGLNMEDLEGYADLIRKARPMFVEAKAYMYVGTSRERLKEENMPRHHEILEFSEKLAKLAGLKVIDQKPESRVCLLAEKDWPGRKLRL